MLDLVDLPAFRLKAFDFETRCATHGQRTIRVLHQGLKSLCCAQSFGALGGQFNLNRLLHHITLSQDHERRIALQPKCCAMLIGHDSNVDSLPCNAKSRLRRRQTIPVSQSIVVKALISMTPNHNALEARHPLR